MSKSDSDVVSINVEAFIMPIAVVVATFIFSVSMYASASKISTMNIGIGGSAPVADNPAAIDPTQIAPEEEGPIFSTTSVDDDAIKGDKNKATVAIVEFSDFECPFCKRFYDETLSQIQAEYIDTGKVVFVYRDLPLSFHPQAQIQAEAAECAGEQGKYFAMHDYIFDNGGQLTADQLKDGASKIGLNTSKFNSCLDNGDMKAEVTKDASDAATAGINGTPGFVVGPIDKNGNVEGQVISGALPFESFKAVIDSYLAQ